MNKQLLIGLGIDFETMSSNHNVLNTEEVVDITNAPGYFSIENELVINNINSNNTSSEQSFSAISAFFFAKFNGSALLTITANDSTVQIMVTNFIILPCLITYLSIKNVSTVKSLLLKCIYA